MTTSSWRRLAFLVPIALAACEAIAAAPGATDLRENPGAFEQAFDREAGLHRLVLLLSPA